MGTKVPFCDHLSMVREFISPIVAVASHIAPINERMDCIDKGIEQGYNSVPEVFEIQELPSLAAIVAFLTFACVSSKAYAQDGDCCANIEVIQVSCRTKGCEGTIRYGSCANPGSGSDAKQYKIQEGKCCLETFTSFVVPVGTGHDCSFVITRPIGC